MPAERYSFLGRMRSASVLTAIECSEIIFESFIVLGLAGLRSLCPAVHLYTTSSWTNSLVCLEDTQTLLRLNTRAIFVCKYATAMSAWAGTAVHAMYIVSAGHAAYLLRWVAVTAQYLSRACGSGYAKCIHASYQHRHSEKCLTCKASLLS